MKKAIVLVLAVLALAGFASMALAAQDVFVGSWVHPMSMWMGSAQAGYGANPGSHAINTVTGPPYADAVVADPLNPTNVVAQILYNKTKETWSGRVVQVDGSSSDTLNLSGSASMDFKVLRGSSMSANVTISKIAMFDSNNNEVSIPATNNITATTAWQSISIPLTGKNLSAENKLFEIIMTDNPQDAGNGNVLEVLLDDIRYTDNSSGKVTVTLTTGVVGVTVTQSINFDLLGALVVPNAALNSAAISDSTQSHFIVTNIGNNNGVYSLNLVNPSGWTADAPTLNLSDATLRLSTDRFALYGIFTDGAVPALTDYKGTALATDKDGITLTPLEATQGTAAAAIYGGVSPANGYNVPAGGQRFLWIGLKLPNQITSGGSGTMTILVVVSVASL